MTTFTGWLLAAALVAAATFPIQAAPVVADVQIVQTGDDSWVVHIRSSEGQSFDVVDPGAPFVVRLHGASLSSARAPIGPVPFGNLTLSEDARGVELRVTLADASLQVRAAQGESPDVVRLTVTRAD
jgi:hypothetical protein